MLQEIKKILNLSKLTARFQPIVNLSTQQIYGYEGLIRGPSDSPLHSPIALLEAARSHGMAVEMEKLCRDIVIESFSRHKLSCKLFLNVSPDCLLHQDMRNSEILNLIQKLRVNPGAVVIELTEHSPSFDYALLREAIEHYRSMGFEIAMDDLGEGFSSLRLWSELNPDYVKIDKHFIQGINLDPIKLNFVRSIQQIAENSGAKLIAEGIETDAELSVIHDLNITFGQGYFFGRPHPFPLIELSSESLQFFANKYVSVFPHAAIVKKKSVSVEKLLAYIPPVTPVISNEEVFSIFERNPELYSLPVIKDGEPVGLLSRHQVIDRFARPFRRELYGRHSCSKFMHDKPLIVDKSVTLHEVSDLILNLDPSHLSHGFIITDNKKYIGMGSGHALLQEITRMQIQAARYANPLTMLPGNVPIDEHIDKLLTNGSPFWACYVDLDQFKAYNDVYGFHKGDELIQLTARLMSEMVDNDRDFLGHIGGDDFLILFQSHDWEDRCNKFVQNFSKQLVNFYSDEDLERGGIETEDRHGNRIFHALTSVSIGVAYIEPCHHQSHHHVAKAASTAKKQAKKIQGNSIFVERRELLNSAADHQQSFTFSDANNMTGN